MASKAEPIWSRTFLFLCLTQLLGYSHNALLTPTLPLYITHLGGSAFVVGLTLAAFSVTSVLIRPAIGYWADTWSDVGVMALGALLLGLSVLLCVAPLIETTMVANALRGIGWAGLNTGGYCLLAKLAPNTRRGEAAGYYTGIQSVSHIIFPPVALWLLSAPMGGFIPVLLFSSTIAVLGSLLGFPVRAGRPREPVPSRPAAAEPALKRASFVDRGVLIATALLLCFTLPIPASSGFVVLYAQEIGIEQIGWYYIVGGSASFLARPLLGRISDQTGRARMIVVGLLLEIFGLVLIVLSRNLATLIFAGIFYSTGAAVGTATTMALAIDRADPKRRGVAMATFSISFPAGMGLGALVAGAMVELSGFHAMFLTIAAMAGLGLFLAFFNWALLAPPAARADMGSHDKSPTPS
jgi:MFS family permease